MEETLLKIKEKIKTKELILVNAKYPFLTTKEVNKIIQESKDSEKISYCAINSQVNQFSYFLDNYQFNKKEIIDIQSIYFLKKFDQLIKFEQSSKIKSYPIIIPWTFNNLLNSKNDLEKVRRLFHAINFPKLQHIDSKNLRIIFLDFDGVLTDNHLFSDKYGNEIIRTSKYDSYSIVRLKKEFNIITHIITSELSNTHKKRAEKIGIQITQTKKDKSEIVKNILEDLGIDYKYKNVNQPRTIFVGNDVNDLKVIPYIDFFCCPSDSHEDVLAESDFILKTKGGEGVVTEMFQLID